MFSEQLICKECGYSGGMKTKQKGSYLLLIFAFLFFIIPGIFYFLWMLTSTYKACPKCNSTTLIPIKSPAGQKIVKEYSIEDKRG